MTRIAAGSENVDVEDWMPSRIYLSVPLMWDILQFNCMKDSREISTTGLLDASLALKTHEEEDEENSTLDIIVATSPEITVNTADGGQDAPTLSYKGPLSSSAPSSTVRGSIFNEISAEQADSLTFNTTPLLYADPSHFDDIEYMDLHYSQPNNIGDSRGGAAWWEGQHLSDVFGHL
jgi:hypothetical protein